MSCLFESLSYFVPETDAQLLREVICDYLETDPVLYDDVKVSYLLDDNETPSDLSEYVKEMRNPETWGSALEIECFCRLYKVCVEVVGAVKKQRFGAEYQNLSSFKILWDGGHYEPILRTQRR